MHSLIICPDADAGYRMQVTSYKLQVTGNGCLEPDFADEQINASGDCKTCCLQPANAKPSLL
jgi:hypothetical protein